MQKCKTSLQIINTFVFLALVALSLAIFANSMTKPIGHDEQMYCTAGVCLAQGRMIYRDFSYVAQMPYHPLLCAALFKIFNTTYYLLVARIFSASCDILVLLCIISIYRRVFDSFPIAGRLLGLAAAVLLVFNPLVDYANGFAWNHDLVILCVCLSFWLFQTTDFRQKSRYWRVAAIAALLTLATCMRITTALVQLLFFAVLLTQPAGSIKQRFKTALPFFITTAVVSIWPIWTAVLAPRAFFLNLVWIPRLNSEWLHQIGMVHNKFLLLSTSLTTPGYFVLIVIVTYLCVTLVWNRRRLAISNPVNLLLPALLALTFFIIALIPPTMWRQYLAVPVPFLVISFACPLLYLRKLADTTTATKHFNSASALIAVCVFVAVSSHPIVLHRIPKLLNPQTWTPIRLHAISEDIAEKLEIVLERSEETQNSKLILTLAPLYALEGGCDIYPQFSAGPFVYRIADHMSPWNRDIAKATGPKTLSALLEKSPPAAVILGVEPEFLEAALFQTAIKPDRQSWQKKVYDDGPVLYFRR